MSQPISQHLEQHLKQPLSQTSESTNHSTPATTSVVKLHHSAVAQAIQNGELSLSLSPLLGCDYVFVSHKQDSELLDAQHITISIQEIIEILGLSPRQSVVVSVNEKNDAPIMFRRHDYAWNNNHVTQVVTMPITVQEQIDFMLMMFNCSSAC